MMPILFEFLCGDGLANCLGGEVIHPPCVTCGRLRRTLTFSNLHLEFKLPETLRKDWQWPMIGGMYHTTVQARMAEALIESGISGFRLHQPKSISEQAVDCGRMPVIPECYILEPTGVIDFVIPEAEYYPPCPECGYLKPRRFGDPRAPFVFLEETWDGSDIVRIRNHWQHIMFFNRKVIEVFRKNGWHHQIEYGENGRPYDSISFGGATSPGIAVLNIDSDTWFVDTVAALKEKYPDCPYE